MKTRTLITILLVLALVVSPAFARGAKEVQDTDRFVKVVSVTEDNGHYDINGIYEDGTDVIYHTTDETISAFPVDSFIPGTVLLIKDSGIMTMSIPPQLTATEIRDVTFAVNNGIYKANFPAPAPAPVVEVVETEVVVEAPVVKPVLEFATIDFNDIYQAFNYSYGYLVMQNIKINQVTLNGAYFGKGVLDACLYITENKEPLYGEQIMNSYLDQYAADYLYQGIAIEPGDVVKTVAEIEALADPYDLPTQFSYSYGWLTTYDLLYAGYDVWGPEYLQGALGLLYNAEPLCGLLEMEDHINAYVVHMNEIYAEYMAELAALNLEAADQFLIENMNTPGIVVYPSGVQVLVVNAEGNGVKPVATDTINCDYTLTLLDGTVADKASGIEFELGTLIPGFVEAVVNMEVGQSIRAYIPPQMGYGDQAYGPIAPNAVLIFDITLNSIVTQ